MIDPNPFGPRLRQARTTAGLSQREFAHLVGMNREYIANIERGSKTPRLLTMQRLIQALAPLTDVSGLTDLIWPKGAPSYADLVTRVGDLTDKLNMMHGKYSVAAQRAAKAERALDALRAAQNGAMADVPTERENAPQNGPRLRMDISTGISANIADDWDAFDLAALTDRELSDLRRRIAGLKREDHEEYAPLICWALNQVGVIDKTVKTESEHIRRRNRPARKVAA